MPSWWRRDSGWGTARAPASNGRLVIALAWAFVTAPYVACYVLALEIRAAMRGEA